MKTVPLHGKIAAGRVALVDDEDYDLVMAYRWNANLQSNTTYAMAYLRGSGKAACANILMHKLITGWPETDHADHDGLNNQRSNLRPTTKALNAANGLTRPHSSRFKGVCWYGRYGKWMARIKTGQIQVFLGYFAIEEDAAHAYDRAALTTWGEYAHLNFPEERT